MQARRTEDSARDTGNRGTVRQGRGAVEKRKAGERALRYVALRVRLRTSCLVHRIFLPVGGKLANLGGAMVGNVLASCPGELFQREIARPNIACKMLGT
jgi:hypothetical protein